MTVRTTRVKSDTSTRHRAFYAPPSGDPAVAPVVSTPDALPPESVAPEAEPDAAVVEDLAPEPVARPDARRALRAARRQRRRLTVVCALVVAVFLALTVLIVDLARSRTTGAGVVQPRAALVTGTGPARPAVPFLLTVDPP